MDLLRYILLFFGLAGMAFMFSGCEDSDSVASALLYEDRDTGILSFSATPARQWDIGGNSILYGIDVEVTNEANSRTARNLRLNMTGISPTTFVDNFGTESRQMDFLTASSSRTFTNYWCFFCGESNEIRIGNYYVIISKSAGSGRLYELEFSGHYEVEGERVDIDFKVPLSTVASAQSLP